MSKNNLLQILINITLNVRDLIIDSFKLAWHGKEKINNVYIWWGGVAYFITYFVLDKIISKSTILAIDFAAALVIVVYFIFHIVIIFKNKPKAPKLTKQQKKDLKAKAQKERGKRFIRKILLKEPLSKWRPHLIFAAIDLFIITEYTSYIF